MKNKKHEQLQLSIMCANEGCGRPFGTFEYDGKKFCSETCMFLYIAFQGEEGAAHETPILDASAQV